MNTNPRRNRNNRSRETPRRRSSVSLPVELLWALIGLLLTIFSTFVEVSVASWSNAGLSTQKLGITYQVGAVLLTGCLGGKNAGTISQIAYVFVGLTLLPVFSQGGGTGYLQEPAFGYILGFIPGAGVCGWLAFRFPPRLENLALSSLAGLLTIHICGLIYTVALSIVSPVSSGLSSPDSVPSSLVNYSLLPLPGQLVVLCTIVVIAFLFRKLLFY